MASSPSSSLVAVGSLSGHMYLIDASNPEKPRVVQRLHVHKNAILELTFDQEGRYLISGSDDGNIFTIDARPSAGFKILGQTRESSIISHKDMVSILFFLTE